MKVEGGQTWAWVGIAVAIPFAAWLVYRFASKRIEDTKKATKSLVGEHGENIPATAKNTGAGFVAFFKGAWDEFWGKDGTTVNTAGG